MLTGIGLRNFKAFGDEMQEAPLSKITLIYGPNSGGKSSIIQALLLLKQSPRSGHVSNKLVPQGDYTDLGSFKSLLHKHDDMRELNINIAYRNLIQGCYGARNEVRMTFAVQEGDGALSKVCYEITSHKNGDALFQAVTEPKTGPQFGTYSPIGLNQINLHRRHKLQHFECPGETSFAASRRRRYPANLSTS